MSAFTYTWNNGTPVGTTPANQLDTVIQELKSGLYERLDLEHYPLDNTNTIESVNAAGRHIPGNSSVVYIGTTVQIAALTGMVKGAIAYDTTLLGLKVYSGSSWDVYTALPPNKTSILAFRAYNSAQQVTTAATYVKSVLDLESFDYASRFNNTASTVNGITAYSYLPNVAGMYFFTWSAYYVSSSGNVCSSIYKNDVTIGQFGSFSTSASPYSITVGSAMIEANGTSDYFNLRTFISGGGTLEAHNVILSGWLIARS